MPSVIRQFTLEHPLHCIRYIDFIRYPDTGSMQLHSCPGPVSSFGFVNMDTDKDFPLLLLAEEGTKDGWGYSYTLHESLES